VVAQSSRFPPLPAWTNLKKITSWNTIKYGGSGVASEFDKSSLAVCDNLLKKNRCYVMKVVILLICVYVKTMTRTNYGCYCKYSLVIFATVASFLTYTQGNRMVF
jgi:hypothetical protein